MDLFLFLLFPNTPRHPKKYEVLLPSFMQRVTKSSTKAIGTVVLPLIHLWFRRSRVRLRTEDDSNYAWHVKEPQIKKLFSVVWSGSKLKAGQMGV